MSNRILQNYIGLSPSVGSNNRYAYQARNGKKRKPAFTMLNHLGEFLSNDFFGWFIHDWRVKHPFPYPRTLDKVHDIPSGQESTEPIVIAVAADWATDTPQSEFIGDAMSRKNPDYTIHLGDTYFSGTKEEMGNNFGNGIEGIGKWPRGKSGSFALIGNHEMFSSGLEYLNMITDNKRKFGICDPETGLFSGQKAPCFCLRNEHWLILGLDTGYQSLKTGILRFNPNNSQLKFPDSVYDWVKQTVLEPNEKRGIIVLTHHQYVTAFHGESEFINPARQLKSLLPDTQGIIWIWGHEHRFAMYGKNEIPAAVPAYGRCIGNGGMPDEHIPSRYVIPKEAVNRKLVLYDKRTADRIPLIEGADFPKRDVGFNGYALIKLNHAHAEITYYASYMKNEAGDPERDEAVFRETWEADRTAGQIRCKETIDLTSGKSDGNRISYFGPSDPARVSK